MGNSIGDIKGDTSLRVQVPSNHILPKACTTVSITQNPSAFILGTWTLRARSLEYSSYELGLGVCRGIWAHVMFGFAFLSKSGLMGPLMIVGDSMETAGAFLRAFRGVIVLKDPPSTPNKQLPKIKG